MPSASRPALRFWHFAPCLLACAVISGSATAAEEALERERLVAAIRQLNILDDLTDMANDDAVAPSRYHFDYRRLRADVQRVRRGIEDYLTPQRAQPRDLSEIAETYRLDGPVPITP